MFWYCPSHRSQSGDPTAWARSHRRARSLSLILVAGTLGVCAVPLSAQHAPPPNRGGFTVSMGVPPEWRWSLGFSTGVHRRPESEVTFYGVGGFYKDIINPMTAGLGILGEGYAGIRGSFAGSSSGLDGGLRLGLFSPVARLAIGADYNAKDEEFDLFLSMIHPLRRGGVFVGAGALRLDYLPGREHSVGIGMRLPVGQDFVGNTRPRRDHVLMRNPTPPIIPFDPGSELTEALEHAGELAHWINRMTVPFTDQWDGDPDESLDEFVLAMGELRDHMTDPGGEGAGGLRTPEMEVEAYHTELDRAFSIATSEQAVAAGESTMLGRRTAQRAREIILEEILLPYNRLLGQKKRNDSTRGLGTAASAGFYEWLTRETPVAGERLRATTWTFARVLEMVEDARRYNRAEWGDSRFVWIPLQLALKPDQHDEQTELNDLVERATGGDFTRGNMHWYVENEQFQAELSRMVLEAEDYHVLWIHDFRGYDSDGAPDEMAFRQVVEAYMPALINSVREYDSRGKFPQYLMFLDQMYFEANGGQLWIDLLQDPLHHRIDLPQGFEAWEDSIAGIQEELRSAVASSDLMQSQALHFDKGWIENVVKVHVSITNPPDASFWTGEVLPFFMGLPDLVIRDHRKISFYDVSESDPYKGMAIYTGMGVGEHYVGASWEDRAMMARGPVLLSLKNSARQLLLNQGYDEDQIPWELKPKERAPDYYEVIADSLEALGEWGQDMQLHNQIGFRFKAVTVFKATLYSLMPPGSVIKAPDSIWGSHFWGAMILGHALRGGRSLVMAPSIDNAPSPGFAQMSRAQEILSRLVVAGQIHKDGIEGQGGLLKVGLYASNTSVGDVPSKLRQFLANLNETDWLGDLYGLAPETVDGLTAEARALSAEGFGHDYTVDEQRDPPKLHLKANYFATREAWDGLLSRPDISESMAIYFREVALQNRALAAGEFRDYRLLLRELLPPTHAILIDYMEGLSQPERDRAALFFSMGSHNQNNRSMVLDGEVAFVVAGWSSLFGLPDFLVITGLCRWIEDLDELEALFPRYEGLQRRISRLIRVVV